MNTMLLKESEIKKIISMRDVIEIVDKTFVDLGEGKTINPTKLNLNLGDSEPTNLPYKASLNAMPAYIAWQNMAGQKWAGGFGLGRREIGRPFINALIMLVEPNYGDFLAVMDGVVSQARMSTSYGNVLRLCHENGQETVYAHLQYLFVRPGEVVGAGQIIGTVGQTGRDTGVHLHFELWSHGNARDPAEVLDEKLLP
mgnify:CR=1 FL=1